MQDRDRDWRRNECAGTDIAGPVFLRGEQECLGQKSPGKHECDGLGGNGNCNDKSDDQRKHRDAPGAVQTDRVEARDQRQQHENKSQFVMLCRLPERGMQSGQRQQPQRADTECGRSFTQELACMNISKQRPKPEQQELHQVDGFCMVRKGPVLPGKK